DPPGRATLLLRDLAHVTGSAYGRLRHLGRASTFRRPAGEPRRILVVRQGYLGDAIAFLPLLAALRRRYLRARIVLGVQPGFALRPWIEAMGHVDEVRELTLLDEPSYRRRLPAIARL